MTENEISPLLGKVLALVDDHCVEKESIVNREFIGPMQELLKCIRSLEIGCLASKPDPLIAELEEGGHNATIRCDMSKMIG